MPEVLTSRQSVVLAALASCPGEAFAPVQVQKLFFLIDENVSASLGGKQFSFEPYDYGPFDKAVYQELDVLSRHGLVSVYSVGSGSGSRRYGLTPAGLEIGARNLAALPQGVASYIREVGAWVRRLTFAQLVGSIYQAFPHMRERSIFVE